ncbi:MAG TPA: PAS domain S-box protein [Tepidisphaeraceae bacterium]|nr:PAS domain S-box protein [Tepidisphaeraceae bacterium]
MDKPLPGDASSPAEPRWVELPPYVPPPPAAPLPPAAMSPEALRIRDQARANLAAIVESSDDAIVSKSLDGIVRTWNGGAQRIFGYTAAEMIGQPIARLFPPGREYEEVQILQRLRRGERVDHFETVRVAKDGRRVEVSVTISPIRDQNGVIVGASKVARDITQQKRYEHDLKEARDLAERANRAKDEFLATLSHELRTPLTPVLAAVGMLEARADLPRDVRDEISMIRRNVETEARLVDDLLDVTRISRGMVQIHPEALDAHAAVRNTVAMFRAQAEAKGVRLTAELSAQRHHVWADAGRLQQVFVNLLSNALKFTPAGGAIIVRTSDAHGAGAGNGDVGRNGNRAAPSGGSDDRDADIAAPARLRAEVSDTGIGVDADVLPRLFKPFERGESEISRQFPGLGLGLSIVHSLVELHGGTIAARSAGRGQGATFTLELPIIPAPAAAPPGAGGAPAAPLAGRPANHVGRRVLLVEDHADTRAVMARLLASFGWAVTTAGSVAEALASGAREPFDVLISDIGLPDGSGADVMRRLRESRPIRGIALSGFGQPEDIDRSRAAGFEAHLTKPVNLPQLRDAIEKLAR